MKVAVAQINPRIGDLKGNSHKIIQIINEVRTKADLLVFPEMALLGYPPEDLVLLPHFIDALHDHLIEISKQCKNISVIIGTVRENPSCGEKNLFNSAAVIVNQEIVGFQDKTLLPTYDVFSERRYFEPAARNDVWTLCGKRVAITICEDIWHHSGAVSDTSYSKDPLVELKSQNPDLMINLSASPFHVAKLQVRAEVCKAAVRYLNCPMIFCNQVGGNDSLIFDGYSLFVNQNAELCHVGLGFKEDLFIIDLEEKNTPTEISLDPMQDLFSALVLGVKDYFSKLGFKKACLGLSGGIDSAVVAVIAKEALGEENVLAVSMPSRFTSSESVMDAEELVKNLGISYQVLPIEGPFESYLNLLEPTFKDLSWDITEENLQSRVRGMLLMALSNKLGYLVLSTGNKSEMAMGYTTLYGDLCGGLAVISDVSKLQVYALAEWINRNEPIIPQNILRKAPSAELRHEQKDSDSLPEYALLDPILTDYIVELLSPAEIAQKHNFPLEQVQSLIRKIHINEYKRRQAPPGIRVSKKAFSVGRRFPIVQWWNV